MKASIKFREEQRPLLRAKIPLNILNFPFQSGVYAGESKELSLNLSTFFDSGPALKFAYRPNDSQNPFSFIFKTGIGHFGSPNKSPLTMSAEFNLIGNQNPSFFIHFKPDFGDFTLKKSHSSGFVKNFGEKLNGGVVGEESFANNGCFKGSNFFPPTAESKAAAGLVVNGLVKGTELSAKTAIPFRDFAVVNLRWGLRVPPQEAAAEAEADEMGAVVVRRKGDRAAGTRLPLLVMNKIGIEHVAKSDSKGEKVGPNEKYDKLAEACLDVKKQLDVIQAENGLLSKALSDLRSDIAAGKMDFLSDHHWNKFSGGGVDRADKKYSGGGADRRGNGDKKSSDFGGESNEVLKVA